MMMNFSDRFSFTLHLSASTSFSSQLCSLVFLLVFVSGVSRTTASPARHRLLRPLSPRQILLQGNKSCSPHHLVLTCRLHLWRARDHHTGLEREGGRGQESGSGVGGQEEVLSADGEPLIILI